MKTFKKLTISALLFVLKFWEWKIFSRNFWNGKIEYWIAFLALVGWSAFEFAGQIFKIKTYPVGYFQKIFFGIIGMSIIAGVTWAWLGATFPELKQMIDPDTNEFKNLKQCEQLKLALAFFFFYGAGAVLLASLY